jgi:hypothetical protein
VVLIVGVFVENQVFAGQHWTAVGNASKELGSQFANNYDKFRTNQAGFLVASNDFAFYSPVAVNYVANVVLTIEIDEKASDAASPATDDASKLAESVSIIPIQTEGTFESPSSQSQEVTSSTENSNTTSVSPSPMPTQQSIADIKERNNKPVKLSFKRTQYPVAMEQALGESSRRSAERGSVSASPQQTTNPAPQHGVANTENMAARNDAEIISKSAKSRMEEHQEKLQRHKQSINLKIAELKKQRSGL